MVLLYLRRLLKVLLNPIIWLINFFMYTSHLDLQRFNKEGYDRYDFSKDIKYF